MQVYIARQPIFNRQRDIIAYELLYRDPTSKTSRIVDADSATGSVLMISTLLAPFEKLLDNKPAFINFTKNLICDKTAYLFSANHITIEILEDIVPDEKFIKCLKSLKEDGYTLALDDFTLDYPYTSIVDLVDIIKVDFMLSSPEKQKIIIDKYSRPDLKFLAEKVETSDDFNRAMDMGYDYFQGYYFAKPSTFEYRDLTSIGVSCFRLLKALEHPSPSYETLSEIVETDVSLTYKLLKYANSPIYGGMKTISSIREALMRLGFSNIRKWMYLIIMRTITQGQTPDMFSISLQRGKMMEALADECGLGNRRSECFLVGLFSMIDIFTNQPLETVLSELPLAVDAKEAIIYKENKLGKPLKLAIAYEKGDWQTFEKICMELRLKSARVIAAYIEALEWSSETMDYVN